MMRHIPKLAAVIGSVTIGLLGFQGVASAGTHGGSSGHGWGNTWLTGYDYGHGRWVYFPPPPPRHHHHHPGGPGYPGTTTTTSTTTTTTTLPPKHHHHHPFPIVFYFPKCFFFPQFLNFPHGGNGHGGGYKLTSSVHHKY